MRLLPGYLIAFVLATVLASTTPTGTGSGVHQFDLLHPLFAHIHIVNGRILTHEQMSEAMTDNVPTAGPAIGVGSGAAADDAGAGVTPLVPWPKQAHVVGLGTAWLVPESRIPLGLQEAPPDPPPL